MKKIVIINVPKKITFRLSGSYADLSNIGKKLIEQPQLLVDITLGPFKRNSNSDSSDYLMVIECPEATYETVIKFIQDFISE